MQLYNVSLGFIFKQELYFWSICHSVNLEAVPLYVDKMQSISSPKQTKVWRKNLYGQLTFFVCSHQCNKGSTIRYFKHTSRPFARYRQKRSQGGCPGLVVIGGESWSEGCVFESHRLMMDVHFFTYIYWKTCNYLFEKTENQR